MSEHDLKGDEFIEVAIYNVLVCVQLRMRLGCTTAQGVHAPIP